MTRLSIRRSGGFSIVELMVSVVIGLLALMFATRLIAGAEQNKQSALGGSDSMQTGMLAMFSITNDASQAGYGLNDPILVGCNTVFSDTGGFTLAPGSSASGATTPLAPVVIESNGAAPDRLTFYGGGAVGGTATLRLINPYTGGTRIDVDRVPYGFNMNDVIVVAPESGGGNCSLAQVSNDPATVPPPPSIQFLRVDSGSGRRFNTGALNALFKGGQARAFNLGPAASLPFHTWSVADGFLQLSATDIGGSGANASTVADNIVSVKAQYGFDTRLGAAFDPTAGMRIGAWSATMIDADSDGTTAGPGDWQRIAAVRVAVVARSKNPERPGASGVCSATPSAPVVFAGAEPQGVTPQPITLNVAVTGDSVDWKCYRYRTFETIVPLRNAAWRPNAWSR